MPSAAPAASPPITRRQRRRVPAVTSPGGRRGAGGARPASADAGPRTHRLGPAGAASRGRTRASWPAAGGTRGRRADRPAGQSARRAGSGRPRRPRPGSSLLAHTSRASCGPNGPVKTDSRAHSRRSGGVHSPWLQPIAARIVRCRPSSPDPCGRSWPASRRASISARGGLLLAWSGEFGRRQLDGQRQLVQVHADRGHGGPVLRRDLDPGLRRPPAEQLHRVRQPQRAHRHGRLAGHPERFPAGRQDLHLGAGRQQRRDQRGAGAEQVLAGVQDEQQVSVTQLVDQQLETAAVNWSGSRSAAATACGSSASSRSVSSRSSTLPSAKLPAAALATARLTAVLPTPGGPVTVTSRAPSSVYRIVAASAALPMRPPGGSPGIGRPPTCPTGPRVGGECAASQHHGPARAARAASVVMPIRIPKPGSPRTRGCRPRRPHGRCGACSGPGTAL